LPSIPVKLLLHIGLYKAADVNTFVLLFSVPKLKEVTPCTFTEVEKP
jgi:hypothetical protein